jgi:hypothetical protein
MIYSDPDDFWTPAMIAWLARELADKRCFRCGLLHRNHTGADHLWFENADERPDEENN